MTDLPERLRALDLSVDMSGTIFAMPDPHNGVGADWEALLAEAADEIERLRAEIRQLAEARPSGEDHNDD